MTRVPERLSGARGSIGRDVLVVAIGVVGIAFVIWSGTHPHGPYGDATAAELAARPYPWNDVLSFAAMIAGETGLLYAILRPRSYRRSWARALVATIVFAFLTNYWIKLVMHAPSYYPAHVIWEMGVTLLCLILLIIAIVGRIRSN